MSTVDRCKALLRSMIFSDRKILEDSFLFSALHKKQADADDSSLSVACIRYAFHVRFFFLLNSVNDEVFIFLDDTNLMRAFDSHVIEGILIPVVAQRLYADNLMPVAGTVLVTAAEIPRG